MQEREIDTEVFDMETVQLDDLLEQLSFEMIKSNVLDQIKGVTVSYTDFLGILIGKFNAILEDERIEESDRTEIKYQMIEFCNDIIEDIVDTFDLAVNQISEDYESSINIVASLYNFFVLNKNDNVEQFFINYIETNKDQLAKSVTSSADSITALSYKKKNVDPINVVILSSLDEVIQFISSSGLDSYDFLNTVDDGSVDICNIIEYFDDGTLNGNFVPALLSDTICGYDAPYCTQMRNSIRVALNR